MKKLLSFLTALLLIGISVLPCLAANELTPPVTQQMGIEALCNVSIKDTLLTPVKDGEASVTLDSDITVKVSGVTGNSLLLVVMPITEDTDGYDWFLTCLKDRTEKFLPFDIYFVDEYGTRVTPEGEREITITLPDGCELTTVFHLSTDGTLTELVSTFAENELKFNTAHNSYYVVGAKKAAPPYTETTDATVPATAPSFETTAEVTVQHSNDTPKTGDSSNMWPWLSLLVISGAVLARSIVSEKHKKIKG